MDNSVLLGVNPIMYSISNPMPRIIECIRTNILIFLILIFFNKQIKVPMLMNLKSEGVSVTNH